MVGIYHNHPHGQGLSGDDGDMGIADGGIDHYPYSPKKVPDNQKIPPGLPIGVTTNVEDPKTEIYNPRLPRKHGVNPFRHQKEESE